MMFIYPVLQEHVHVYICYRMKLCFIFLLQDLDKLQAQGKYNST